MHCDVHIKMQISSFKLKILSIILLRHINELMASTQFYKAAVVLLNRAYNSAASSLRLNAS